MRIVRILAVAAVAAVAAAALGAAAMAAGRAPHMSRYAPANRCFALRVPGGTFVATRGASYAASAPSRARATAFDLKPGLMDHISLWHLPGPGGLERCIAFDRITGAYRHVRANDLQRTILIL